MADREARTGGEVVIVKFHAGQGPTEWEDHAENYLPAPGAAAWAGVTQVYQGITLMKLFRSLSEQQLTDFVERAEKNDPKYEPARLHDYYSVPAPESTDLDALARVLDDLDFVEVAYVHRPGPDPAVNTTAGFDPGRDLQGHLEPAPKGIGATHAWNEVGGDGAGQTLMDVERGWTFLHEDLAGHGVAAPEIGAVCDDSRHHGTAVLGIACARNNQKGMVGIAPNVGSLMAAAYKCEDGSGTNPSLPDAIAAAALKLGAGDVLLIEAQVYADPPAADPYPSKKHLVPVEFEKANFDAIKTATAAGIVVIEPAGNGRLGFEPESLNFDDYGVAQLEGDPTVPDMDSGAIIVAHAREGVPHVPLTNCHRGSRIDCYAWGRHIATLASDAGGSTDEYQARITINTPNVPSSLTWANKSGFSGTSGASAIIAGAALGVQGIRDAKGKPKYDSKAMRGILGDPDLNTPAFEQVDNVPEEDWPVANIGVMPDLRSIITNVLCVTPDVYVRDHVGDKGDPHEGPVAKSPDIIVQYGAALYPQANYGEGSGTEDQMGLGVSEVNTSQRHYLHLRVRNRRPVDAQNVTVSAYHGPVATALTSNLMTEIGSVVLPIVPAGNQLTVSGHLPWEIADIPRPGHYSFLAVVSHVDDPAGNLAGIASWDRYCRAVREHNNYAWRNYHVVDLGPKLVPPAPLASPYAAMEFLVTADPNASQTVSFEVCAQLPLRSDLWLEIPLSWLGSIKPPWGYWYPVIVGGNLLVPLRTHGVTGIANVSIPGGVAVPAKLHARIDRGILPGAHDVSIRQLWQDHEVGRITWRFNVPGMLP